MGRKRNDPVGPSRYSKVLAQKREVVPVELTLPKAHDYQNRLIRSFDARLDPSKPELGIIYDGLYPNFKSLPKAYPHLRFVVGAMGSKSGKTYGCATLIVDKAWRNESRDGTPLNYPGLYWWVAPSYSQSKMAYRLVKNLIPKDFYEEYKADLRLVIKNPEGGEHSLIEFKTAQDENNLRGFAVNFFVFDEAARGVSYDSFVSVMTTVTQTFGSGIIISTPNGRNWFYDIYQRGDKATLMPGEEDLFPEWLSFRMSTWKNPYVKDKAIEDLRRNLPQDVFEQEVAARFMTDGAGVFRGIDNCIRNTIFAPDGTPLWEEPISGRRYVIGADLAKKGDYTVLTVMDCQRKHVVYWERFNRLDWVFQKERIKNLSAMYNHALVIMDATGLGDVVHDDLRAASVNTEPYVIGGTQAKAQLIDKLRVNIEFQRISFPQIVTLVKELRAYEFDLTTAGRIKYSAPSGQHDDCVISLALANWAADRELFKYQARQFRGI